MSLFKIIFLALSCLWFISASAQDQGSFKIFKKNISYAQVNSPRDIYVYLPPGYNTTQIHYPVLYMQDGQNLFDPKRAFLGQTWNALNTLNDLISRRLMAPIIVVAIDNTPSRMDEYIPEKSADAYLEFVIKEVKPLINQSFRTRKPASFTGIMGSSLGGLVSLYAGVKYREHFGLVGALSPSIWWNDRSIISTYDRSSTLPLKIYLDSGTLGGEKPEDVRALGQLLNNRGFAQNYNLLTYIQEGAEHREAFWSARFPMALRFLFPLHL